MLNRSVFRRILGLLTDATGAVKAMTPISADHVERIGHSQVTGLALGGVSEYWLV